MGYSDHGASPRITNISFTNGTTELSHVFRLNVKKFDVSTRFGKAFRYAYREDDTEVTWKTVPQNSGYFENFIKGELTLYLLVPNATAQDPETIEILEWESAD